MAEDGPGTGLAFARNTSKRNIISSGWTPASAARTVGGLAAVLTCSSTRLRRRRALPPPSGSVAGKERRFCCVFPSRIAPNTAARPARVYFSPQSLLPSCPPRASSPGARAPSTRPPPLSQPDYLVSSTTSCRFANALSFGCAALPRTCVASRSPLYWGASLTLRPRESDPDDPRPQPHVGQPARTGRALETEELVVRPRFDT